MSKAIKAWGTIGGFKSESQSYTVPATVSTTYWQTDEDYTEVTYTVADGSNPAEGLEPIYPDEKTLIWFEVTMSTDAGPNTTVTIKTHTAKKIEYPNDGQTY